MKRKAIFLDIDGVVVYDSHYLVNLEELRLFKGAAAVLKKAQKAGFLLMFISNKGGAFAKKGMNYRLLNQLDERFKSLVKEKGVDQKKIATYYCIHYPKYSSKKDSCNCRKPKAGLFTRAIEDFSIEMSKSYVVGDKVTDLIPCINLGCRNAFLVKRNQKYFDQKNRNLARFYQFEKYPTLTEVIEFILREQKVPL